MLLSQSYDECRNFISHHAAPPTNTPTTGPGQSPASWDHVPSADSSLLLYHPLIIDEVAFVRAVLDDKTVVQSLTVALRSFHIDRKNKQHQEEHQQELHQGYGNSDTRDPIRELCLSYSSAVRDKMLEWDSGYNGGKTLRSGDRFDDADDHTGKNCS